MNENKVIKAYLMITFGIISIVFGAVVIFNQYNLQIYGTFFGLLAIAFGGLSSAVSGAVVAKKTKKIATYKQLFTEFFNFKQPVVYYICIVLFLLLLFGTRIWNAKMQEGQSWLDFPLFFVASILFGGVEEIGWRYLFQPALERKTAFWISSLITFSLWGIWHMMYFVIDGSFFSMNNTDITLFLCGLLGTSFILGAIFNITKSLWLCVLYHALLNAFTQLFVMTEPIMTIIIMMVSVTISVFSVALFSRKSQL